MLLTQKKLAFDNRIKQTISYLIETLNVAVDIDDFLDKGISWECYGYYFMALDAINSDDEPATITLLYKIIEAQKTFYNQRFDNSNSVGPTIIFADEEFLQSEQVALIRRVYDKPDNNEDAYLFGPFTNDYHEEETKLSVALTTIQQQLPHYWNDLCALIEVLIITGPTETRFITSASTIKLLGCVIIGAYGRSSIFTYLEDLIHEAAHHQLFLEQADDELILNSPEQKYPAPFRHDLRPMAGLFHAHFVLGKIYVAFRTLHRKNIFNEKEFLEMKASAYRRFMEGKNTIDKHAVFTEKGQEIYTAINVDVMSEECVDEAF